MADQTMADKGWGSTIRSGNRDAALIKRKVAEATVPLRHGPCIKGTADHQVVIATEETCALQGIIMEDDYNGKGIDEVVAAADPVDVLQGGPVTFAVLIQANVANVTAGQKLVVSSEGKWKAHPDDLATVTGDTTVLSTAAYGAIFDGYRNNPSYVISEDSLTKDTTNDKYLEARFASC